MSTKEVYLIYAYSGSGRTDLQRVKKLYSSFPTTRRDKSAIEVTLQERSKIFVFDHSTVVFLNVDVADHSGHLNKIAEGAGLQLLRGQGEDFAEDDYLLKIGGDKLSTKFNEVIIPRWDEEAIFMAADILAKSAALEVIESRVQDFLQKSQKMNFDIRQTRLRHPRRASVIRFIAEGLATRHELINQLCLLQKPPLAWEKELLDRFHSDLIDNFELESRLLEVEKVLELSKEVSNLQLEMLNTRRGEFLEIIIILLIAFEIVHSFFPVRAAVGF